MDLVFDRDDDCITLCEIKHTDQPYVITKESAAKLEKKASIFEERTGMKKQLLWCLISSGGVVKNEYYNKLISNEITLEDFFVN